MQHNQESIVQIHLVEGKSGKLVGVGSGFFVEREKVVTNIHAIYGEGLVSAKSVDGEMVWEVEGVAAFDVKNDLVILKVSGEGKPLPLGNSDVVQVNEPVSTLGFPETEYKVTEGSIQSIREENKKFWVDAEYVGGMSGGPMLNSKGEVVGVAAGSTGTCGVAVSSNALKILLSQSGSTEPLTQFRKKDPIRAYTYYAQGQFKFLHGNYAEAVDAFDKTVALNPEFAAAYGIRGVTKLHLGQSEEVKENAVEAQHYYHEAVADFNTADKLGAEEGLGQDDRVLGYAKTKLGESEMAKGNVEQAMNYYNKAIADFNKAIKLNSEYAGAYSNRGYTKTKLGQSAASQGYQEQARAYYCAAIDDCTEALRLNSAEYAEDSLMRHYAKLLLEPEDTDTYRNRGDAKFYFGEFETDQGNMEQAESHYRDAVEDYTETINLKSDYALAYYSRGLVKQALGLQEEAQADFDKAAELNREIEGSRNN